MARDLYPGEGASSTKPLWGGPKLTRSPPSVPDLSDAEWEIVSSYGGWEEFMVRNGLDFINVRDIEYALEMLDDWING